MEKHLKVGPSEIRLSLGNESFESIVEALKAVLTIPKFGGFGGCAPCRSGLDRIVIEDPAWRELATRQFAN